jgi:hypothetical protein
MNGFWIFINFLFLSSSFLPYSFIFKNKRNGGGGIFRLLVAALDDGVLTVNASHYLPIPDMLSYEDSNLSGDRRNHQKHLDKQYEAFQRLFYVEPNARKARVNSLTFFGVLFISFFLLFPVCLSTCLFVCCF